MLYSTMLKYNREYNQILHSATIASGFSIDFKSNFDYKMYRIIIGSKPFYEENPYEDIANAQDLATKLQNEAKTDGNKDRAQTIYKFLENLARHVNKIEGNLMESGHYDENMTILENDIRVLTLLIQDTVLEYIYYETLEMEQVRVQMYDQMMNTMKFSLIMLGIVVTGGLFSSVVISNSISKPIKQLSTITNQVAKGDLTVRSNIKNGVEVKVLSDSLNIMIEKLSNLIEAVKVEQSNLRETELRLLQEQINPHFLYNTLDTITWLAEANKSREVVLMVGSLSNYFRTSLSSGKDLVTLGDEELHVRSYLQIQQLRYEDILTYEITIEEELATCRIPKISLQPLVENALYHGIKNKRGMGKIIINGKRIMNDIILTVSDNGIGMTKERLEEVLGVLSQRGDHRKDIYGLYNVNERLHLYFGEGYGINIQSEHMKGTKVSIKIPVQYNQDK